MSIYSFEPGPKYRPLTPQAAWDSALSSPLSLGTNFGEQVVGGALSSYVLGSTIRDTLIPQGNVERSPIQVIDALTPGIGMAKEAVRGLTQNFINPDQPSLSEDEWKASPSYRENIPYDPGMTAARAEALAAWDDARKVREHFASKRPFSSFVGNLGGQALDPINYVPVVGPLVRAAAVAKVGKIAGAALISGLDAAANTALAAGVTYDTRGAFGDEVSWQGTISEIATAALIGGAFGTIGGAIGARSDARAVRAATDRLSTLRTTQEARIALNEAIDGIVSGEDIRLSPNATEPMARVLREVRTKNLSSANEVDRSWAGADVTGQSVVTPTGLRIAVKSEVVNALDLVKASGDLQPRDRSRAASDAQIADIAANLDPARLMFSPEADRGAPIVGPDGIIESGNGRVAALMKVAKENPEKFEAYKQALRDAGYDVPADGIPVLISRRTSELTQAQRAQFVHDANTSAIARMSATETAQMDVRAMTGAALDNYVPGDVNSAANRAFVGSFMRNLPANERLGLVDAYGHLNADGIRRVENALIATAYGDADVVARFAESPDDNAKSIMGAMVDASGEWAAMRRDIAQGIIDPEHDVTANLTNALRFISMARDKAAAEKRPVATVIKESIGQIDLLAGDIDPRTKAFVQSFYKNDQFTQANGRDILAEHLSNITRAARELGQPQLFGDATSVSPSEMIANARPQNRQADIFGAGRSGTGGATDGQGGQVGTLLGDSQAAGQGNLDQRLNSPAIAEAVARMDAIPRTELSEGYGSPEWFEARVYDFDREKVQGLAAATDRLVERARALASLETGAPRFDVVKGRKATIIIGPPAAGKSTIANAIALRQKAAILDVDDAKKVIPEYQGGIGANAVHEESSDIGKVVQERLVAAGDNLIIPKVGHNSAGIEKLRASLKENGYDVDLVLMDVTPEVAMGRMLNRFEQTGRLIPPAYFTEVAPLPKSTFAQAKSEGKYDGFAVVESRDGVPPRVAETSGEKSSVAGLTELVAVGARGSERGVARPGDGGGALAEASRPIDLSTARPDPIPDGRQQAEANIGKPDDMRGMADQFGVDMATGKFAEMDDIEQLRALGRLTDEDEAAWAAASQTFEDAEAYGNTLKAALNCVV